MIFGIPVSATVVLVGGVTIFILAVLQTLIGQRVIKLGKRHRVVHRWTAYVILGIAAVHGLMGLSFALGLRIF